jgi:hypothetical protein
MPEWVVAVPAWGERYLTLFEKYAFPSLHASLRQAGIQARFIIHTDNCERLVPLVRGRYAASFYDAPMYAKGGGQHTMLGICQREAL